MFIQSFIETERSSMQRHDSFGEISSLSYSQISDIGLEWLSEST